jgi:hypothetical protein
VDATTFPARVEAGVADELDALGSRRLLDALTGGDPTRESLLEVVANSESAARETFDLWVQDGDERTREAFRDMRAQEARHYDLVADLLDGHEPVDGGPLHAYLRSREDPVQRVGAGLVGRPLYTLRAHDQLLAFFEGRDEAAVAVIETLRSDTAAALDRGTALLVELCADDGDRERARATAEYAVTVAYDDYRDWLVAAER